MRYELKNMLTTGVMAKELGVNRKTLKKWAKQRKVPYYRNPVNGYWYFNKKDVLAALGIDRTVEGMIIDILRGWEEVVAMEKAVIYVRVSTKDQERSGYSIPAQLRSLRDYADKNSLKIVEEFRDTESAGKAGRTAFGHMVQLLKADRTVTELLVEKTDRLYRNFSDHVLIDGLGVTIHFVKDGRILGKDAKSTDKFINDIQTAQARFYLNNLSDEVKKGQRQKAREGKFPGGIVPLGYLRNGISRIIETDPDRESMIRELFEFYSHGDKSIDQAHRLAKSIGLTYRKSGRLLARSGIERLLKCVFYTGKFEWNGNTYQGDHPQLVTDSLFDRVQVAFQARSNGKTGSRAFVFSRLIICSECGKTVTAEIKKKRYTYYHCTGYGTNHKIDYVPENILGKQFASAISAITIPDEFYNYLRTCLNSEIQNTRSTLETEKRQLEITRDKIESDMKKTLQKNLDGKVSDELLCSIQSDLQVRLKAVNYRLENLASVKSTEYDRAAKTIELSHQAEAHYLNANPEQKRKLIKSTLSNCTLDGRTLCPTYRKPFDLFAEGIKTGKWRRNWDTYRTAIRSNHVLVEPQSPLLKKRLTISLVEKRGYSAA